ncbi:hypothetical protein [Sphingomonas sp.]|uniref:hypothetical protein n=1 Tax=Sphingomonas sp. TaxID=28214 RepID=UPI0025DF43E0|nr:hypothetical protein [Sphingomonas sp.]
MVPVSSGDVMSMSDERFSDLLDEFNSKQGKLSLAWTLAGTALVLGLISAAGLGVGAIIAAFVLTVIAAIVGAHIDATRRSVVVMYNLEQDASAAYQSLTDAFDHLAASSRKWHVDAGGKVRDIHTWKRNAGASTLVDKRPTQFGYGLPRVLKSNVTPPTMQVGKETLYFLPDLTLVVENGRVGAVAYDALRVTWQDSRFIEEDSVPSDAQIVGETWKYPNKNGGPDRRFANNRRLPICLYESFHLGSANGLNELLQVSTNGRTRAFASAVQALAAVLGRSSAVLALPNL